MSKSTFVLFVLILTIFNSYGQQTPTHVGHHKVLEIKSKELSELRSIEIYLPPSYDTARDKKYPVMYVMDGQEYFLHPVAYQRMLRFKDKSPEFIVVGVHSDRKKRRKLFYENSDKFIGFLTKELIPFIDSRYRTMLEKERIYFGWEMAGGLGLEVLASRPALFSAFFLASPTHFTENRILKFSEYLLTNGSDRPYLHFSLAPEEVYLKRSFHKVDSILKAYHFGDKGYNINNLLNEDHYTTSLKTMNNGLRNYFHDYNTLRFYSLKEYDKFGDLNDIKKYYLHRGERYGISSNVHRTTQHFLLFNAMKEDNFERFQVYANEFSAYFENLSLEIWALRFGGYLAQNNNAQKALGIYNAGLRKFPNSAAIHDAIGTLYKSKKELQKALLHYKKAVEIAKKNGDKELEKYNLHLKKLEIR